MHDPSFQMMMGNYPPPPPMAMGFGMGGMVNMNTGNHCISCGMPT
jgi:hypothetical protein